MRVTEDGEVVVGIDDFAQSLIGTIDGVRLPRLLKSVEQGGVAWLVWHGHRHIPMVSPVSGRVIEKNEMLPRNPSLINDSPYSDGWLFKIHPRKLAPQLHNLFTGKWAQALQDMARTQLSQFFSRTPALMYQDGGVITKNLIDRCSDDEWNTIKREFLLVDGQ
jgi:glycine cleavage system H protein